MRRCNQRDGRTANKSSKSMLSPESHWGCWSCRMHIDNKYGIACMNAECVAAGILCRKARIEASESRFISGNEIIVKYLLRTKPNDADPLAIQHVPAINSSYCNLGVYGRAGKCWDRPCILWRVHVTPGRCGEEAWGSDPLLRACPPSA